MRLKYNELVYQGSKSHGLSTTISSNSENELHMPTECQEIKRVNLASKSSRGQNKIHS